MHNICGMRKSECEKVNAKKLTEKKICYQCYIITTCRNNTDMVREFADWPRGLPAESVKHDHMLPILCRGIGHSFVTLSLSHVHIYTPRLIMQQSFTETE